MLLGRQSPLEGDGGDPTGNSKAVFAYRDVGKGCEQDAALCPGLQGARPLPDDAKRVTRLHGCRR